MILLLGLGGCNEEEPATFKNINGIYFNNRLANNTIVDSTNVTFVYTSANSMNIAVKIQALGRPVAYSRPIDINVIGGNAVEGTDFKLITTPEMPAGTVSLDYNIQLNRTTILKQEERDIVLALQTNDHFILPFEYQIQSGNDTTTVVRYRIIFSDRFTVAPESWNEDFGGTFSQQKFELICRVLEIDPAEFNSTGGISPSRWQFIFLEICDYVATQVEKKEAGENYDKEAFDPTTGEPLFNYNK